MPSLEDIGGGAARILYGPTPEEKRKKKEQELEKLRKQRQALENEADIDTQIAIERKKIMEARKKIQESKPEKKPDIFDDLLK